MLRGGSGLYVRLILLFSGVEVIYHVESHVFPSHPSFLSFLWLVSNQQSIHNDTINSVFKLIVNFGE